MTAVRDHYRVMGLDRGASAEEVRAAYLRLARTLHPDRFMDASDAERRLAERRMREVNAAWEVLGSPDRRGVYDRAGTAPPRSPRADPAGARPAGRPSPEPTAGPAPASDPDDVELSRPVAFLLRRGPILVFLAIALGLFVGTAVAGRGRTEAPAPPTSVLCVEDGGC